MRVAPLFPLSGRSALPSRNSAASNFPGPPGVQHGPHGRVVDAEQLGDDAQVRGERDDRADVEVAVRPSVEPAADAGRQRIVDRRMAEGALDADGAKAPSVIEEPGQSDDRIQLEKRQRRRWIVEVHLAVLQLTAELAGERIGIDLQADAQCGLRADARADAAEARPLDRLMELERAAPELLVAERVEAEDALAVVDRRQSAGADRSVDGRELAPLRAMRGGRAVVDRQGVRRSPASTRDL
jgi:hypothetical protein